MKSKFQRGEEDIFLRQAGWKGGGGEWRHPSLDGCFSKSDALANLVPKERISTYEPKIVEVNPYSGFNYTPRLGTKSGFPLLAAAMGTLSLGGYPNCRH